MPLQIIDHIHPGGDAGTVPFHQRLRTLFQYGRAWYQANQLQPAVLAALVPVVDEPAVLHCNLPLPPLQAPLPMVLIAPPGIQIIYPSNLSGFHEIKSGHWLTISRRTKQYATARKHPLKVIRGYQRALQASLQAANLPAPMLKPLVVLTHPGIHVEGQSNLAGIQRLEHLAAFFSGQATAPTQLPPQDLRKVTAHFAGKPVQQAVLSLQKAPTPSLPGQALITRLNLSLKQWKILGGVFGLLILVLIIFTWMLIFFSQPGSF